MNNISAGDKIFDFECENNWSFSYYGWEFDNCHAFYNYMFGYKTAADASDGRRIINLCHFGSCEILA